MNNNDLRRKALTGGNAAKRASAAIQYADQIAKAKTKFRVGDVVVMTDSAIENYGEEWRDVTMRITSVATEYMPAKDFFAQGKPEGYHPGYDEGAGGGLYDLERMDGGEVNMSLYDWELEKAPAGAGKASRPAMRKEEGAAAGLWEPTEEALKSAADKVQAGIQAPFVKCSRSSLGGLARSAVMIALSLDPKEEWANGIFENGRSGRLSISRDGVIEHFSGGFHRIDEPKYSFRKARVKTLDAAIAKINAFVAAAPQASKSARPAIRKGRTVAAYPSQSSIAGFVEAYRDVLDETTVRQLEQADRSGAKNAAIKILEGLRGGRGNDKMRVDAGFLSTNLKGGFGRKATRPAMRKAGSDEEDKLDEFIEQGVTDPDAIARRFLDLVGDDEDALRRVIDSLGNSMRSDAEAVWRSLRAMSRKASRPAMRKAGDGEITDLAGLLAEYNVKSLKDLEGEWEPHYQDNNENTRTSIKAAGNGVTVTFRELMYSDEGGDDARTHATASITINFPTTWDDVEEALDNLKDDFSAKLEEAQAKTNEGIYPEVTMEIDRMGNLHVWQGADTDTSGEADLFFQGDDVRSALDNLMPGEQKDLRSGYTITTRNFPDDYFMTD